MFLLFCYLTCFFFFIHTTNTFLFSFKKKLLFSFCVNVIVKNINTITPFSPFCSFFDTSVCFYVSAAMYIESNKRLQLLILTFYFCINSDKVQFFFPNLLYIHITNFVIMCVSYWAISEFTAIFCVLVNFFPSTKFDVKLCLKIY